MALDTVATASVGIDRAAVELPAKPDFTAVGDSPSSGPQRSVAVADATAVRSASLDPQATDVNLRRVPVTEITARSGPSHETIGHRILDRLEAVHKADLAYRVPRQAGPADDQPVLKVAAQMSPGPAEAHLSPTGKSTFTTVGTKETKLEFSGEMNAAQQHMLQVMRDSATQRAQVNVLVKTTGSFGTNLNKLLSAN